MVGADATSPHQQPKYGWRKVSEQLDLLRAVVVQLVSLVTASTVVGRATLTSPGAMRGTHSRTPPFRAARERCGWNPPFHEVRMVRKMWRPPLITC
ncbi:unnamed protein product [Lampetra planeri]